MDEACVHRLLEGNRRLRNQAHRTFNGKREYKPDCYNRPKKADDPSRGLFQKKTEKNRGQNQPIGPNGRFDKPCKKHCHDSSSTLSIICRTNSRSASVSGRFLEKAARNAGNEP